LESELPYYRGKALLEQAIKESGMSYAIIRPAVLFGNEDILINNIAWMLRHLPVMGIFGDGKYRMRPIHVEDLAKLMVEHAGKTENAIVNAVGPESFSYIELVNKIGEILGVRKIKIHVPAFAGLLAGWLLGLLMKDTVITGEEIKGLMQGLLYVEGPATGQKKLTEWLAENKNTIGMKYASELARRKDRVKAYDKL
jgi:NADH dehydrogenase